MTQVRPARAALPPALVVVGLALWVSACGGGSAAAPESAQANEPVAAVQTALASSGSLSAAAMAYATTSSAVAHTRIVVMPHEGIVTGVEVHDGDSVKADQSLVTIGIAPAAAVQLVQTSSALKLAEEDLARVQRLFAEKLATNDQVATARKALADAQAQMEDLRKTGADRAVDTLRAPFAGVVTGLSVTPGDRPAVGAAVATVSSRSDVVVQLGLEPADAAKLAPGARVRLQLPGAGAEQIVTKLTSVGAAVDATSRLVKAVAQIPAADAGRVTLGATLIAHVDLPPRQGIIVARSALLEDAEGPYVFTVDKDKAHRQPVVIGVESDDQALIVKGLEAGAKVIVANNAALEDGVAVEDAKPGTDDAKPGTDDAKPETDKAKPSATEPKP
jgi:RND family efflux transporter MFP subunit